MADLGATFNANDHQPVDFDVLPAGEYDVIIVNSERKNAASGNGWYLKLEMQVLNGPCQNQKLWDILNVGNSNEKAKQIACGTLSSICRAIGVMTLKITEELHNKPMRLKVIVKKSEEYGEQNEIKKYMPRNSGGSLPVQQTFAGAPPMQQPQSFPVQQPQQPAGAGVAVANDEASPWG